jgi:hypothetical protein
MSFSTIWWLLSAKKFFSSCTATAKKDPVKFTLWPGVERTFPENGPQIGNDNHAEDRRAVDAFLFEGVTCADVFDGISHWQILEAG